MKAVIAALCLIVVQMQVSTAIGEDLNPRISLDMASYMVAEDGTSVTVCAELSNVLPVGGTTSDISTTLMLTDGVNAVQGSDFSVPDLTELNVDFPVGSMNETQDCLTISIIDDDALEGNHMFMVSLSPPASPIALTTPSSSPVTITDDEDDGAAVQMVMAAMNVDENVAGGSVAVCAEITGVSELECAVSNTAALLSTDTKAGIGTDFASSGSLEFSFPVGTVTPACIDVSIIDDNNLEGDHTFTVSLGGTNTPSLGGGTGGFGAQTTTAITIQDPEDATVVLSSIPSVTEGSNLMVTVILGTFMSGTLDCELVVTLVPTPDTAIDDDYSVTFRMGSGSAVYPMESGSAVFPMESGSAALPLESGSAAVLSGSGSGDAADALTVTFPVGSSNGTTMTALIAAVNDAIAEGDEEFLVSLGSTSPTVTDGLPTSVTATILDDDLDEVEILMHIPTDSVYESGMIDVCARIGALPKGGLETDLDVTLSTMDGAKAVVGEDFTFPLPLQVTFSSGDIVGSTACATFDIIDDNNLEFDHEFTVGLASVTPTGPMFLPLSSSMTTVTINDDEDDNAAIQMVMATMNVAENVAEGSVAVCAEITGVSGMLECEVSNRARLKSTDRKARQGRRRGHGRRRAHGQRRRRRPDFASSGSLEFSFPVGAVAPACIDVIIIDDFDLEGDHTFTVRLGKKISPSLGGGNGGFGAQNTTAVTIQDPEDAMVGLQMISPVAEGRNFRVSVLLKTPRGGTLDCDLTVTLLLTNGTAIDTDYRAADPLTVTFYVGDKGAVERARISAVDDAIAEDDEEFTVSIDSTYPPCVIGPVSSQNARIMASDLAGVVIQMVVDMDTVAETGWTIEICAEIKDLPAGGLGTDLVVALSTSNTDGKAVVGEDYTEPLPLQLTFSSGDNINDTACATFGIIDDDNLEFDHEFTVSLSSVTPTGPVLSAMSSSTTVTITDDEAMNADISMQNSTLMVSEEDMASIDVCAVINGVAGNVEEEVTATLTLVGSTKAVLELDFNTTDSVASFPVGTLMPGCITVSITQDMSVEGDHSFSISLNPGPITPTLTVGMPSTTEVTINDDASDTVTIMFEEATYTGSEGGPPVSICAQITDLMGTLDCDLVVTFSDLPGKAVYGEDYTITPPDVFEATFTAGSMVGSTACDGITILDDLDLEGLHTFSVQISGTHPSGSQIMTDAAFTTVEILDNDGASLQFEESEYSASEAGPLEVDVCVVISGLTGELQCDLVVTLSDLPGTSTDEGQDYTTTPAGVYEATFPSATTVNGDTACDTITIIDDDVLEGPHDFGFRISGTSPPGSMFAGELTTVNIEDNETATIGLTQATFPVMEDVGQVDICVEISDLLAATEVSLTVTLDGVSSGKAVEEEDFTIEPPDVFEVIFPAGTVNGTTVCDPCSIINDEDFEGDHSFAVRIQEVAPNLMGITIGLQDTNVEITDDEGASLQFEESEYSASEAGPLEVDVCVVISGLTGELQCDLVVTLSDLPGTSTDEGQDYTTTPAGVYEATFPSTTTMNGDTACDTITIIDDDVLEGPHDLAFQISGTSLPGITSFAGFTTVNIEDDETATIGFNQTTFPVREDDGQVDICVEISDLLAATDVSLTVTLDGVSSGKAVEREDFTIEPPDVFEVIFPAGTVDGTTMCDPCSIINDDNLEGDHSFAVRIQGVAPNLMGITIGPQDTNVEIIDDEGASLQFEESEYSASEAGPLEVDVCVVISGLTGELQCDLVVTLSDLPGTSTVEGQDYTTTPAGVYEATFPSTTTMNGDTACDTITIIDDDVLEGPHDLAFLIRGTSLPRITSLAGFTTVNIEDNENAMISLIAPTAPISEDAGDVQMCCARLTGLPAGGLGCPLVADLILTNGAKAVNGEDFSADDPLQITFTPGVNEDMACAMVLIIDDDALEGDHEFTVSIGMTVPPITIDNTPIEVMIEDNEVASVALEQGSYSADEGGMVEVCAVISNVPADGLECPVVATLSAADGKAVEGDDYVVPAPFQVTFDVMSTSGSLACTNISIPQDFTLEGDHEFTIHLSALSPDVVTIVSPPNAEIVIADDEMASVALGQDSYSATEGGMVEVCAVISNVPAGGLECPVVATLSAADGKAVEDDDYVFPAPFQVMFDTMSMSGSLACINIIIPQDLALEGDHEFTVHLSTLSPDVVTIGSPAYATIVIADDESATISLNPIELTVDEGSDPDSVNLCVVISNLPAGGLQCDLVATLTPMEDTALAGEDYNVASLEVVIPTSAMDNDSVCVNISDSVMVIDDHIVEFPENFTIELTRSTPPVEIGAANSATVTIVDNDKVTIGLEMCEYAVIEGESQNICGTLDGYLQRPIYVYLFIDSSNLLLHFGSTASPFNSIMNETACVSYSAADDDIKEDTEQLTLRLISHDDAVCLCRDFGTISVVEDAIDGVQLSFVETDYTVDEDAGVQHVCVELTGALETSISVTVDTQPNTALVGEDFVQIRQTLVFDDSTNTTQCVYIPIINDDCVEDEPEEFTATLRSDDDCVSFGANSTSISIFDNDCITIGFQQSDDTTVNESAGVAHICAVMKCGCIRREVEVNLFTQDGTATAGSDYSPINTTLTFTSWTSTQCVYISILEDNFLEDTENFFVHLTTSDDEVKLQYSCSTINILNNDGVELSFVETDYTVDEDASLQRVCVELTGELDTSISVTVDTQAALVGEDFVQIRQTLVFDDSTNTTQCVYIPISNDDCVEDEPEEFTATLRSDDDHVSFGANSASITIFDDDCVTIGFQKSDITVNESAGVAHICAVMKCGCIRREVEINLFTQDGTATAGSDYSPINTTLTFTSWTSTQCAYISILEDNFLEDTENFFVHLTTSDDEVKLQHSCSTINIFSNDGVELSFVETDYTVDEDASLQRVCVELTGELDTSISVTVDTQAALVGENFVQIQQTLVFDDSTNTQCVYIPISNDDCVEDEPEEFTATLRSDDDRVSFGANSTSISIFDDDCVTIGLQQSDITVSENASLQVCAVIKFGCLRRDVEVNLFTQDGTATAGSDFFAPMSVTLTFTPVNSDEPQCVTIRIEDDHALERTENFFVHLATSDEDVKLQYNYSTITILDNDDAMVGFTMANYMVSEVNGSVLVCVSLTGYVERPVVVTVITLEGSAVAVMDYNATTEVIEFTAAGVECVSIPINMDGVLEEEGEQFTVILTTRDDAITIGQQFATVTIMESDVVNIGFAQTMYTLSEEDPSGEGNTVQVCIVLMGELDDDVEVVLATMAGSATGGVDYMDIIQQSISLDFTFRRKRTIGPNEQCTTISLISDDLVEDDETFHLQLSTMNEGVVLNPATAYVTITNNDDANIALEETEDTVGEADGSVTVCAELTTGNLERSVTVFLSTVDGTATGGRDYGVVTSVGLTYIAGSQAGSTACVNISIINDEILESDEFFTVTLSSSDPVNFDVSMGSITIIEDADSITVALEQADFTVTEGSDSVLPVNVAITDGSLEREVLISFSTIASTATADGDYGSVDLSLTFSSGETAGATRTINVNITDDLNVEDDESFLVTISADNPALPGDPVMFGLSTAQVTIIEDSTDMVTIGFERTDESVAEDAGNVSIHAIIISGTLERELCLEIFPVEGSALGGGIDFMAETVKLTFSLTVVRVYKQIIIINDAISENDEIFSHRIQSDDPAAILNPDTATVTIVDDDEVCIGFIQSSYTVCEGDPAPFRVCVDLVSGELARDVTVTVQTEDDSALAAGDYISLSIDVNFASGVMGVLQCIPVTITDDGVSEPCERFFMQISTDISRVKPGNDTAVIVNDNDPLGEGEVCFTGDTPRVTGDTVDIQFDLQGCASVTCSLTRGDPVLSPQDCTPPLGSSTGMTTFTNLPLLNRPFTLTLSVQPLCGQPAFDVTRRFRRDNPQCSVHLINKGLTITGNSAMLEWEGTGPNATTVISEFSCRLDRDAGGVFMPCSSPFTFSGLGVGDHRINLRPNTTVASSLGCSGRFGRSVDFTIL